MKLYTSPTSPFARKVRVVVREKNATSLVTEEVVIARQDPPALHAANPLGKIPALVLDDGTALFDSPVICEYLDATLPGPLLFPATGPARWQALRLQAAADGLMDAAVSIAYERMREEGERSPGAVERWSRSILRTLDFLEGEAPAFGDGPTIGTVAIGCALGYLDLRFDDLGWRGTRPVLDAFHKRLSTRPSFSETGPA